MTSTASATDINQQAPARFRILVPVDGSDLAAQALPVAANLYRQLGGELELVRAVPPVVWPYSRMAGYESPELYEQLQDDAEREAREYLERTAAGLQADGIPASTRLKLSHAEIGLLDVISSQPVDLMVMTTHGRTGLARVVLGSVADAVVRSGAAPVLLLRPDPVPSGKDRSQALSRALVPLDGTALAETPLFTIGQQLAGQVVRELTLLRVVDPKAGTVGWTTAEEYLDAARQRLIDRLREQGRECMVSQLVRWGSDPAAIIVACAPPEGRDLVLMATHIEGGIGRVMFGGVTDRVLREGKTPLLLMHPRRR